MERRAPEPVRSAAGSLRRLWKRAEPVRRRVVRRFEVDSRSLAALRIALGLVLIVDLVHRAGYVEVFYTDAGAYPLSAYEATYTQYNGLSLHAASGEAWFQTVLFVVAGLFAAAFVVGYRTRLVGFVSLALLFSLHARNPAILNGGDRLLRVLLFVSLVAPIGERWSVDAIRRGSYRKTVASLGTAAVLVQPVVVFTSNAAQKHVGNTWYSGDALGIALSNDVMTVFLGDVIANYPGLLTVLNYGWVVLLAGSSVFLLLTVGRLRAVAALVYVSAFAGMLLTMAVGLFPLVLTASVLPFLTTPFWEAASRPFAGLETPAFFDRLSRTPVEHRALDALRDRGYGSASEYAVEFGRSFLTVAGFLVLVWMLAFSFADATIYDVPDEIDYTNLDQQSWGLYAPNPSDSYSWYPVEAEFENGSEVDAFDGGPVSLDHPPDAAAEYETFRHRKFMQKVRDSSKGRNGPVAEAYADWACRRAVDVHGDRVESVTVHRVHQESPVEGERQEPDTWSIIDEECGESGAS